jgi:hypothetical protein
MQPPLRVIMRSSPSPPPAAAATRPPVFRALVSNTTGSYNTATGFQVLLNSNGDYNTANGHSALLDNTTGAGNTANGAYALQRNSTGSSNIALGTVAGENLTTGSNNIDIGNRGVAGESNKIRIGAKGTHKNTFIAGIYGKTVASASGVGVMIDANGKLGTVLSSARYKRAIKPMDKASEALLALEPVTFRYKHELDPEGLPQFGLIAEQVEKVDPNLVVRDEDGKVSTVRYEAVNAMLLNEFLKEHRQMQQQEATITQLKSAFVREEAVVAQQQKDFQAAIAQQQSEIKALTRGVQKMSDQRELNKPSPRLAANNE